MADIPAGSSLDHAGVDRRLYEEPVCGSTEPHGQHYWTQPGLKAREVGGLTLNCPGLYGYNPEPTPEMAELFRQRDDAREGIVKANLVLRDVEIAIHVQMARDRAPGDQ